MDEDFALALRLQEYFDSEEGNDGCGSNSEKGVCFSASAGTSRDGTIDKDMSLVDPRWETLDPNPDVRTLFLQFNERFFSGELAGVEVKWSPRMTLCAGLCSYEGHGGLCSVRLSQPLLKLRPRKDLVETLLHEMIHAYLFVTANNRDHDAHGPEFHKHMKRINQETGTSISVYHSFHDEVDHHHQHWWRCNGPCQKRKPYFGYVKRAMNRAPHPRDTWWADHQGTCGGTYTKIKEPDDYGKKKSKVTKDAHPKTTSPGKLKPKGVPDIRSAFGSIKDKKSVVRGDSKSSSSARAAQLDGDEDVKPAVCVFPGRGFTTGQQEKSRSVLEEILKRTRDTPPTSPQSVSMASPLAKVGRFSGSGVTLGENKPIDVPQRVVRRLPGIGLITSERPLASSTSTVKVEHPTSPTKPTTHPALSSKRVGENVSQVGKKRKFEESSESDTDSILQQLRMVKRRKSEPVKKAKRNSIGVGGLSRSLRLDESLSETSPGSVRRVPGFRSVAAKNAEPPPFIHKDPKVIEEEREWLIKRRRSMKNGGIDIQKPSTSTPNQRLSNVSTSKRTDTSTSPESINFSSGSDNESKSIKKNKKPYTKPRPKDLAVNRNRRAIFGDSDSSSDSDCEQIPLRTVHSKTKQDIHNPFHSDNSAKISALAGTFSASVKVEPTFASGKCTSVVPPAASNTNWSFVAPPSEEDPMQECPVCTQNVFSSVMNHHLDACLSGF